MTLSDVSSAGALPGKPPSTHRRSLSVPVDPRTSIALERALRRNALDGSASVSPGGVGGMGDALFDDDAPLDVRELAMRDPKRARRVLANRQSAARSKERKAAYMMTLEKRLGELVAAEEALEVERDALMRDVATLGAENTALEMLLFEHGVDANGSGRAC